MKLFVVLTSYAAVASAGFVGFSSGGSSGSDGGFGSLSYSAPGSSSGGGFANVGGSGGGGYSSDFNSIIQQLSGGQASFQGGSGSSFRQSSSGSFRSSNSGSTSSSNSGSRGFGGGFQGQQQQQQQVGQVRRFVSVHVAPEEEAPREPRIIRAGGPPDTHYNIIFVKAPSGANQQRTEVVLPEPPKQKTLVYVLLKRPDENQENVKLIKPAPTKASKPEVYFIRYKADGENGSSSGSSSGNGGRGFAPSREFSSNSQNSNSLDSSYGAPQSQQNEAGGY